MATGHLPVALLRLNFRAFVQTRESRRLVRRYPPLADFIQYMEDVYVGEQALFPREQWCVFGLRSDCRSNNFVEGNNLDFYYFYPYIIIRARALYSAKPYCNCSVFSVFRLLPNQSRF